MKMNMFSRLLKKSLCEICTLVLLRANKLHPWMANYLPLFLIWTRISKLLIRQLNIYTIIFFFLCSVPRMFVREMCGREAEKKEEWMVDWRSLCWQWQKINRRAFEEWLLRNDREPGKYLRKIDMAGTWRSQLCWNIVKVAIRMAHWR